MARHLLGLLFAALLGAGMRAECARADWMNLTGAETAANIAEITVEEDRVRLVLEVYVGDLAAFDDLVPDDWLSEPDPERPALAERLRRFSQRTFRFETPDGVPLEAELKRAEARMRKDRYSPFAGTINPSTRQRVPEPPADKRVLYAELEYPFEGKPEALTIVPPLDRSGVALVNVGFIAYHKAVPVIDFRYLAAPATLRLDWADPWYSAFEDPTLKRHHRSALMSFLYVEPDLVRHEVLTRLRDLEQWMDLGLSGGESIEPEEWEGLMARVGEFLLSKNPVAIDGTAAEPRLDRAAFVSASLTGIQTIDEPQRLDLSTAILGVILTYEAEGMPREVTVEWDLFTDQIRRVPATTIDPAGPFMTYADPEDRSIVWQNHLIDYRAPSVEAVPLDGSRIWRLPLLTLLLGLIALAAAGFAVRPRRLSRKVWAAAAVAGAVGAAFSSATAVVDVENPFAAAPAPEDAARVIAGLLGNLHTAQQMRDEAKREAALALTIAPEQADQVRDEAHRALAIEIQGGGRARVDAIEDVTVTHVEALAEGAFRTSAEWRANASAGHWGHLHQRRLHFSALLEVAPSEEAWKIAGLTVLNVRQE